MSLNEEYYYGDQLDKIIELLEEIRTLNLPIHTHDIKRIELETTVKDTELGKLHPEPGSPVEDCDKHYHYNDIEAAVNADRERIIKHMHLLYKKDYSMWQYPAYVALTDVVGIIWSDEE